MAAKKDKKPGKPAGPKRSYKVFVNELLDGSIMDKDIIRRNAGLLVLMVGLIFVYISNHYAVIMRLSEIDTLQKELTEAKYEALTRMSDLMKQNRQSFIQEKVTERNLGLEMSKTPPYVLERQDKKEE